MSERIRPRGLGRGLSALMADVTPETGAAAPRRPDQRLPVEVLHPNPNQPRRSFAPEAMEELTASVREKGVIQPLIVRPIADNPGHFEIVAGERRWRAAQAAQLHEVPVLLRDYSDTEVLEIAIIENIQRADLSAIDEAAGYRQLMDRFGHTQEQLATALGKSRSHIANLLRLLSLPEDVQAMVGDGRLTAGHARTLVGNPEASTLARRMAEESLSVRAAERLTRKQGTAPRRAEGAGRIKDADTVMIERELSAAIGMRVSIEHDTGGEGGRLIVHYRDLAQFDDLLRALSGG
ncbi:MAG: ParB/RepB/Spo0J family partition protein [Rubellimicrobium sp.]|nr:ParB/RepB/Spo0J family partition protein [Rubellimicrobium sp.]